MPHLCPVCGYPDLELPPCGSEGGGSYEICPCCGFQFGVDDDDRGIAPETWRERWVAGGMKWWSRGQSAPPKWNPAGQLERVTTPPAAPTRRRTGGPGPRGSRPST